MTKSEAVAAKTSKAFVKFPPTDGRVHWGGGFVYSVEGTEATIQHGSRYTRVKVDHLVLDKARNAQQGITVPRREADQASDGGEYVIFDAQQWVGYAGGGGGWTDSYDRWRKFRTSAEAVCERDRLHANGISGLNVLTFSAAFERLYQHAEATGSPSAASADAAVGVAELAAKSTVDSLTRILSGSMSNARAMADAWQEVTKVAERDAALERDILNDRDVNARLEREIAERQRLVQSGEHRIREKGDRREQLKVELAGLTAKLAAMMPK